MNQFRRIPDQWETEIAEFQGLQLIKRTKPHTWFDMYYLGMHIGGTMDEATAWVRYFERVSTQ